MQIFIGLGTNLGDRVGYLRAGLEGLDRAGYGPLRESSVWLSEPVGTSDPQAFLNMVVRGESEAEPLEVLATLLEIERGAGRVRAEPNGPRTLDMDLLWVEDRRLADPRLTLPHPRMWQRRFVLAPLAELAPGLVNPATGRDVEQELASLPERPGADRLGRLVRV